MKKIVFALGLLMATSICVKGHNLYNNHVSISLQTFYDELSPYGEWIYTPDYGYAWRPYLGYYEEFTPYATRGNWVYTDLGWTWVSDYRWGWATFHYGRWFYDDYMGWMWMPGYEWAPAWVTWGSYNDYWAWAPLGPNVYVNVNYAWRPPSFWWTFVPFRHFCSHNWHAYIYDRPVQVNNITYINNYYYGNDNRHNTWTWDNGPRVPDVERHTKTKVQKRTLVDADKPGAVDAQANLVKVYRPDVTKKKEEVRPANYRTVEQVKSTSRTTGQSKTDSRTQPVNRQTTETNKNRYNGSSVKPPVTTQTTRQKENTGSSTQRTTVKPPVKESTPARTPPVRTETKGKTDTKGSPQSKGKTPTQPTPRSK